MDVAGERRLDMMMLGDDLILEAYLDETSSTTKAMRIGAEREPEARQAYEFHTGMMVEEVGSIAHPFASYFASSPDGVITDKYGVPTGCIEIKCPTPRQFIRYCLCKTPDDLKKFKPLYYWQCISHMEVTGTDWCDFIAFNPYDRHPLHTIHIEQSDTVAKELMDRVWEAEQEIQSLLERATKS